MEKDTVDNGTANGMDTYPTKQSMANGVDKTESLPAQTSGKDGDDEKKKEEDTKLVGLFEVVYVLFLLSHLKPVYFV